MESLDEASDILDKEDELIEEATVRAEILADTGADISEVALAKRVRARLSTRNALRQLGVGVILLPPAPPESRSERG